MFFISNVFLSVSIVLVASIAASPLAKTRIYNGEEAVIGQFPYQILLRDVRHEPKVKFICGGAIVSEKFILTAAHCISSTDSHFPQYFRVFVGAHTPTDGQGYDVKKIFRHEKFHESLIIHDIALFELAKSIEFSVNVALIEINRKFIPGNLKVVVAGWGLTNDDNANLKFIVLDTITNDECRKSLPSSLVDDFGSLCTHSDDRKRTCGGDSGGPLTYNNTVVGIVSWGMLSCDADPPDVYTRVSNYIEWIDAIMEFAI